VPALLTEAFSRWETQVGLIWPLLLSLWMAAGDLRNGRIPNYLTLGAALAGLAYQFGCHGAAGLMDGFLGILLGFALLILPYIWGGMGAGDVKALASLGAWLGLQATFYLFCYMALAGGLLALAVLAWRGCLGVRFRQGYNLGLNWILCRGQRLSAVPAVPTETKGIPYAVALALGMGVLVWRGVG